MHRPILLLCCALLGLAPGCASKRSEYSAAPSPDYPMDTVAEGAASPSTMDAYGGGSSGGDADYGKKAEYAEEAPSKPMEAAPTTVPASPAVPQRTTPSGGMAGKDGSVVTKTRSETERGRDKEVDEDKEPQKQVARQIIYTAEMQISVFKFDEAMERAEALTLESGGYVQSMSQGYYILRVPAAKLRGVMAELGKLGVVESRSLQAQDVTEEFVDLTTRIRVLRETQAQLLTLLKQARNVEEALSVRRSLDQITMELEQAMGRLRLLESLIGFSTLTVRMSQRGPQNAIPSSNDPFPWVDQLGVEATEWN
jgi:hypothetical protein